MPDDLALGTVCLALALCCCALVLPGGVAPDASLPLPRVGAAKAGTVPQPVRWHEGPRLSFAVRAVGEAFRHFGHAREQGRSGSREIGHLRRTVRQALSRGYEAELSHLEALQGELFLRALDRWERTGQRNQELSELGGSFARVARQSEWIREGRLILTADERRVLFRIRWLTLTDLVERPAFSPSLAVWRVYYRFLLRHPEAGEPAGRRQLKYVGALARLDPEYPADYARGVLAYQLGHPARAADAFRRFLDARGSGPWTARAERALAWLARELPSDVP